MQIYLFSFTKQASLLSLQLKKYLSSNQYSCTAFTMEQYALTKELTPLKKPLKEQVADCFQTDNILIFISACGICVRSIAPFIKSKTTDPCVLVIDEKGNYVISLLSGHLGGGNAFTEKIACYLKAQPIISTATDLNHKFAVDLFAQKNNLQIQSMQLAKEVSAALLNDIPVGLLGALPSGSLPNDIVWLEDPTLHSSSQLKICISPFQKKDLGESTLYLIPKQVVLGIGCRKETTFEALKDFVLRTLEEKGIFKESIAAIASIDLKKEEPGLIELSKWLEVPFVTYNAKELQEVPGDFSSSKFVQSVTGVDNVCERATLKYSNASSLFQKKIPYQGMTLAISMIPLTFHF